MKQNWKELKGQVFWAWLVSFCQLDVHKGSENINYTAVIWVKLVEKGESHTPWANRINTQAVYVRLPFTVYFCSFYYSQCTFVGFTIRSVLLQVLLFAVYVCRFC